MTDDNKYKAGFLAIAAVVIAAAFFYGKCGRDDQSYKLAGVEKGDIVVNAHKYNPNIDPPQAPVNPNRHGGGGQ